MHRYMIYVNYYSIIMEGSRSQVLRYICQLLLYNYGRIQVSRYTGTHSSCYSIIMEGPRSAGT